MPKLTQHTVELSFLTVLLTDLGANYSPSPPPLWGSVPRKEEAHMLSAGPNSPVPILVASVSFPPLPLGAASRRVAWLLSARTCPPEILSPHLEVFQPNVTWLSHG